MEKWWIDENTLIPDKIITLLVVILQKNQSREFTSAGTIIFFLLIEISKPICICHPGRFKEPTGLENGADERFLLSRPSHFYYRKSSVCYETNGVEHGWVWLRLNVWRIECCWSWVHIGGMMTHYLMRDNDDGNKKNSNNAYTYR